MSRTRTYVDKLLGDTEYLLEQWGGGAWMGWGSRVCVAGRRYHEPSHANVEPQGLPRH